MTNKADKKEERLTKLERVRLELNQSQEALRQAQAKFEILFHKSLDVIMLVDGQTGRILDVNQVVRQILGYDRAILLNKPFSVLFPDAGESATDDVLAKLQIHGSVIAAQEFRRADGSICPMDVTVNLVPWDNERAIFVTLRDVTERTEAETAQQKLIQELDAFAHTVAHDLKTPIAVMMGAAQTLNLPEPLPDDRQDMIRLIVRNGQKMVTIIDELLLLAEIRDADVTLYPLKMSPIVAEVRQRLDHLIREKQAKIILPSHWPAALGYGPWIEEVWTNYLSNALKYGGQPPRITLGGDLQADGMVRFWISDNGAGLTPEEQAQLFTRFARLSPAGHGGHGLGLSIVQSIVEKLGGQVGVTSEPGRGSVFSFTLPAAPSETTD